jgi:acyl-coenzyme A synthetase/AMP-(fatty) acid ligase
VDLRLARVTDEPVASWSDDLGVAPGEIGEVVVGGPVVSRTYREAPDANIRAKIADGVSVLHRTGDLGRLDSAGRLWFCGRKAHRVPVQGGFVAPVPVENVANRHADIRRTALVGADLKGAVVPVLCVEMKPGRPWDDVVQRDLRRLLDATAFAGLVRHFLPHPGFPTDARHNSKIRSEELALWATRHLEAR